MRPLRDWSIAAYLRTSFMLVLLVLSLLVGAVGLSVVKRSITNEIVSVHQYALEHIKDKMRLVTDHILAVSNIYYLNDRVRRFVESDAEPGTYDWYADRIAVQSESQMYDFAFDWLRYRVAVIGLDEGRTYQSFDPTDPARMLGRQMDAIRETEWFRNAEDRNGVISWEPELDALPFLGDDDLNALFAVRLLHNHLTGAPMAVLIIASDNMSIERRLFLEPETSAATFIVFNSTGEVVGLFPDSRLEQSGIESSAVRALISDEPSGVETMRVHSRNHVLLWDTMSIYDWVVVSVVPEQAFLSGVRTFQAALGITLVLGLVVSGLVASVISRRIARPIVELAEQMSQFESGALDSIARPAASREVSYLADEFNSLVARTRTLVDQIVFASEERRLAEIRALQFQINPHFLYNTLSTIRMMARVEPAERIEEALSSLSRLLQHSRVGRVGPTTVGAELEMIQEYLRIVNLGVTWPVTLDVHMDPGVRSLPMPRVVLQPIVENSVFHGIKPAQRAARIQIHVSHTDAILRIAVIDDGVGTNVNPFDRSPAKGLGRAEREEHGDSHVGLKNIADRLHIWYGDRATVLFDSQVGSGCQVVVRVPTDGNHVGRAALLDEARRRSGG